MENLRESSEPYKFREYIEKSISELKEAKERSLDLEVVIPIGRKHADESPAFITLGDSDVNVEIVGQHGVGKLELIKSMLCSLSELYKQEEVECYYIDTTMCDTINAGEDGFEILYDSGIKSEQDVIRFITEWIPNKLGGRLAAIGSAEVTTVKQYNKVSRDRMVPIIIVVNELKRLLSNSAIDSDTKIKLNKSIEEVMLLGRTCGIHIITTNTFSSTLKESDSVSKLSNTKIYLKMNAAMQEALQLDNSTMADLNRYGMAYLKYATGDMIKIEFPYTGK